MSEKTKKETKEITTYEVDGVNIEETRLVSKELRQKLKDEHGSKLRCLILPLDDFGEKHLEVLAVVPTRRVVGQAMKFIKSDPYKTQEILVKNCLKTSKEEVLNDDELFSAAADLMIELIPQRQGKFGKV